MVRIRLGAVVVALFAIAACSQPAATSSPAETQAGAAADLNRAPHAGAASARCKDLPSADDLTKWLRAAPGTGGEAGGLFSGQMEWAAIVNREREAHPLCANTWRNGKKLGDETNATGY